MSKKTNPHWGPTLDEFLEEEGILEEVKIEVAGRLKEEEAQSKVSETPPPKVRKRA